MSAEIDKHLSRTTIIKRAKERWNARTRGERKRCGGKYRHIFHAPMTWFEDFNNLNPNQKNVLIKGELIRTYDSLPNSIKTEIKNSLGLSTFSSKWFRLSPSDKKKLLIHVLGT